MELRVDERILLAVVYSRKLNIMYGAKSSLDEHVLLAIIVASKYLVYVCPCK